MFYRRSYMTDELKSVAEGFFSACMDRLTDGGKQILKNLSDEIQVRLRTGYKAYLEKSYDKYSKAKSFFTQNQAIYLYDYYVPSGVSFNDVNIHALSLSDALEVSSKCIISGTAGSGKSVLLRHLFLDTLKTKKYVPVILELRDFDEADSNLTSFILRTLANYGLDLERDIFQKLLAAEHFAFLLDGYDELSHKHRKKIIRDIKTLCNKGGSSPVILTSRPDEALNELNDFCELSILPLTLEKSIELVDKLQLESEVKQKFIKSLQDNLFKTHRSFLSNPLLLTIMLLTYGDWAEIPSTLSRFYDQAFQALYQRHDANKGAFYRDRKAKLDSQQYSLIFANFALRTYEKRQIKMTRDQCLSHLQDSIEKSALDVSPDDYLEDSLKAVCLLLEDGLDIVFAHRSFQEYFVAKFISQASPELQAQLVERYAKRMGSDNVFQLLFEINAGIVERNLIVPYLNKLFNKLGVSKSITRTAVIKYLKLIFARITIEEDNTIWFTLLEKREEVIFHNLLHFTCLCYQFKPKPGKTKNDQEKEILLYKKKAGTNVVSIDVRNEGVRSGLLKDILDLGVYYEEALSFLLKKKVSLEQKNKLEVSELNQFLK